MNTELMEDGFVNSTTNETATVKESSTVETIESETRNRPSYKTMYEESLETIKMQKSMIEDCNLMLNEERAKTLQAYRQLANCEKNVSELPADFNSIEKAIIKLVSFDKFFCNIEVNETGIKVFSVTKG